MKIAGYEFAEGARFQAGADAANAKVVGERLDHLRNKFKGELTPDDVVEDARNSKSPLHPFFEWNDGAAAEHYRLQQARGLIRSVVAIYTRPDMPAVRTKMFVHISEPGAPHYREASHAMGQADTRHAVLQTAWRELQSWRKKYAELREFSDLFEIIDDKKKLAA